MLNKKAQNMVEYAVLVALVIGAAVAMQTYVKRSLQGKIKDATDAGVTETLNNGTLTWETRQYEPYYAQESMNTTQESNRIKTFGEMGRTNYNGADTSAIQAGSTKTTLGVEANPEP